MSWLGGRLTQITTLDCLKASLFGLGNGDCASYYSSCNLTLLKEKETAKLEESMKDFKSEWIV